MTATCNTNFSTHKRVVRIGEGQLAYCEDCCGGEIELYEQSCAERQAETVRLENARTD